MFGYNICRGVKPDSSFVFYDNKVIQISATCKWVSDDEFIFWVNYPFKGAEGVRYNGMSENMSYD